MDGGPLVTKCQLCVIYSLLISNILNLISGDQILSLISMKCSSNWLLRGGERVSELFNYLALKYPDFVGETPAYLLLCRVTLCCILIKPLFRNLFCIWFKLCLSTRNLLKHLLREVMSSPSSNIGNTNWAGETYSTRKLSHCLLFPQASCNISMKNLHNIWLWF